MRTRVKLCGFTRPEDVHSAVQAGADALGLVFYPKSRRYVTLDQAKALRAHIPAFVSTVCLFVNADPEQVRQTEQALKPELLQFHGDEDAAYCAAFATPYIKALRVGAPGLESGQQLLQRALAFPEAKAILLDAYTPAYGGSGSAFDPALLDSLLAAQRAEQALLPPLVLAGGMRVNNVAERIRLWRPFAVDVSSGVETSPGIKSTALMHDFVQAAQQVDAV